MKVEIYSKDGCGYCVNAKSKLNSMGTPFIEYKLNENGITKDTIQARVSPSTIIQTLPQIFIDDNHIGGYNELLKYLSGNK